ncbi:PhnD/SsuA/transferrin family substrate-binding protein [Sulfuricystis multivorans]|uniref:PhnD/SsuA/transferrin family substrate-binding protein n=1 Tax=Sulfuricystis multivorans TaxID=2211108 RepID=UPI000F81F270|nr:PhnD/SsuA/transferrin family substrate-binding protein [Sulfuricystis multivorans]
MKFASELFSVCPHDTAKNLVGWYTLNSYIQRHLGCRLHFEPKDNFLQERAAVLAGPYRLVYANPFSAAIFRREKNFIPVARPVGFFDETFLVGSASGADLQRRPLKIASATDKLIVHILGLELLDSQGILRSDCEFVFTGNHLAAAQAAIQGKADLAFVYNETWQGMADSTRQSLRLIAESQSRRAYHCFCLAPEWRDKFQPLQELLCSMHGHPQGSRILADLHFSGFEPAHESDLDALAAMID